MRIDHIRKSDEIRLPDTCTPVDLPEVMKQMAINPTALDADMAQHPLLYFRYMNMRNAAQDWVEDVQYRMKDKEAALLYARLHNRKTKGWTVEQAKALVVKDLRVLYEELNHARKHLREWESVISAMQARHDMVRSINSRNNR